MKILKIKSPKYGEFDVKVDDEDWGWISQYNWFVVRKKKVKFYVIRNNCIPGLGNRSISIHREILKLKSHDKITVDHINGDSLDNRK